MANNNCSSILQSLKWCEGATVLPGIKRRMFIASKSSIVKFPKIPRDELGRPTSAKLTGVYVMVEGHTFKTLEHYADKAQFKSDSQGEGLSKTFKNTAVVVHPGVGENAALATAGYINSDNVAIVEDMDGKFRVIGSEFYETNTTASRDQGQGPTGTPGTTITFEASDIVDSPFYEGPIPTEDGVINEVQEEP